MNVQLAGILNSLGHINTKKSDFTTAITDYKKAEKIVNGFFGVPSGHRLTVINNIGLMYENKRDYDSAIFEFKRGINAGKHGKNISTIVYTMKSNLANVLTKAGYLHEADSLYTALLMEEEHNQFKKGLLEINSSSLYFKTGKDSIGEEKIITGSEKISAYLLETLPLLSENGKLSILNKSQVNYTALAQRMYRKIKKTGHNKVLNALAKLQLTRTSAVLKNQQCFVHKINLLRKTTFIDSLYMTYLKVKREYSNALSNETNATKRKLDSLKDTKEYYENQLTILTGVPCKNTVTPISPADVQQSLKRNEALVQISSFNIMNEQYGLPTDSIMYYAIIYKKDTIIYTPLFEEKQLLYLLKSAGSAQHLYKDRTTQYRTGTRNYAKELYALTWKPLETSLKTINTLYLIPDKLLNGIAFNALLSPANKYLCDRYKIEQLISADYLVLKKDNKALPYKHLEIWASVNICAQISGKTQANGAKNLITNCPNPWNASQTMKKLNDQPVINTIKSQYLISKKVSCKFYVEDTATESRFKRPRDIQPDILYISTHGLNKPRQIADAEKFASIPGENALHYTGLALYGAAFQDSMRESDMEDNILTAEEITNIDLQGVGLVILNSCKTGIGETVASEGAFAMQRALKIAGVKTIIVALWDVSEKGSNKFMEVILKLLKSHPPGIAFTKTQQYMRETLNYPPTDWAGFILIQ
jgi:CHAT domain-containing protein